MLGLSCSSGAMATGICRGNYFPAQKRHKSRPRPTTARACKARDGGEGEGGYKRSRGAKHFAKQSAARKGGGMPSVAGCMNIDR